MDLNQTNEDELQKAIDDITNSNTTAGADNSAANVASELEAKIQTQMGVPPVPPMEAVPAMPVTDANVVAENTVSATADAVAAAVPAQAVAAVETVTEANTSTQVVDADLAKVKESMLKDLFPLMDKIKMQPEQKFKVYKQMIESTQDKSMIAAAYEVVKGITDETTKAEALLYLVEQAG